MTYLRALIAGLLAVPTAALAALTPQTPVLNHTDNASATGSGGNASITCAALDAVADAGDILLMGSHQKATSAMSIGNSAGQTWTSIAQSTFGTSSIRLYHTQYNGTCSADPQITGVDNSAAVTMVILPIRPSNPANTYAVDVAAVIGQTAAPSSPFNLTITGITTLTDGAIALAGWHALDDLTWTLDTSTSWAQVGGAQYRNQQGTDISASFAYKVTSTAGATGNVMNDQTDAFGGDATDRWIIAFKEIASAPTFTSAPAIGTRTTGSIPINATSDTTGTMYGGRLTDGSGTPTCDQLEAQTATGGVQYASEAVVATVADTLTFGSITDGTVTDGYFCIEDGSGNDSAVASIADMYKIPAFTTALTIASQTSTEYTTNSKVLDGPGTVHLVGCTTIASAPSVANVEAHAGCTLFSNTDDATGAFTLTATGTILPEYTLYYVGTYDGTTHEAAVHTLANEPLDAPSGKQYVKFTSISGTSWCADVNAVATPDIATGDITKIDLATDPGAFPWTQQVDCNGNYTGDSTCQLLTYDVYDTSVGAYMAGGPGNLWFNCALPVPPIDLVVPVPLNSAMTQLNLATQATDSDGHTLVATMASPPTGLSVASSVLQGTATVQGIYHPDTVWLDVTGQSITAPITIIVGNVTVPDCDDGNVSFAACQILLHAVYMNDGALSFQASDTVAAGNVISQSRAAGSSAAPFDTMDLVISRGSAITPWQRLRARGGMRIH